MKISVIIPVYNAEKYIREALDSVINQSLADIEIICINDGSKDSSLEIMKEYAEKDSRIRIIDKENEGYGKTVNRGLNEACGEFVAIFEPDDILDRNIYETLYKEAIENNLDVVKCNFYNYWSQKNKAKKSKLISRCASKKVFDPKDKLKIFTCHASVWTAIYKKSFLDSNNLRFLETPGASFQDMSFTFKVLALVKRIKLIDKPLLYYRQDNPNSSINNPAKVYCVCDEYDELTRFLNADETLKKDFNTQKLINQYRAYLWNLTRLSEDLRSGFLKRYSEEFQNYSSKGEILDDFFKSVKKSDFKLLIKNPEVFYKKVVNKNKFYWIEDFLKGSKND